MDEKPYTVHSDSKITLSPMAREMAKMHGMTEAELARHLLNQHKLQAAGLVQREGEG